MRPLLPYEWQPGKQPSWPCPIGCSGRVHVPEDQIQKSLVEQSPFNGLFGRKNENQIFTVLGACISCNCPIAITGLLRQTVYPPQIQDEEGNVSEEIVIWNYVPTSVIPSPPLIRRPDPFPPALANDLFRAERLFWDDASACGNALRCLVESFLTDRGIPTIRPNGSFYPAHARIEEYRKLGPTEDEIGKHLEAMKWLGNDGTHSIHGLTRRDVEIAFRLCEQVLLEAYDETKANLAKVRDEINAKKGKTT